MGTLLKGNAVIGQSGGPTCVINQSLVGVIESIGQMEAVDRLLGAHHGVRGVIEEDFIELHGLSAAKLEAIAQTPSAALGSSRDKPDQAYCERIFEVFRKYNVHYFFYIGGNDSADTARIVNELANQAGHEMRTFHIPKTIDNDLRVTDHCPGYGSAAKFVACALMGDDRDNASLPGVKIDVIMGRNAGWLTAAAALGRRDEADGPHLIYVPERKVSEQTLVADVEAVLAKHGRCVVAVSEGIEGEDGELWAKRILETQEKDAHGNVQLSGSGALGDYIANLHREELSVARVRSDTFGYLQRGFAGFASAVDQAEARLVGRKAVEYAKTGNIDGSVAFNRIGQGDSYMVECFLAKLQDVARETKGLPDEYLTADGRGVTDAFRQYAMPLTGGLPEIGKLF